MTTVRVPLAERMSAAARELQHEAEPQAILALAARLAVDNVRGCDAAGISLVRRERTWETLASTDEAVERSDALQQQLNEGPNLDVIWEHRVTHSPDLAEDDRWPTWGPLAVADLGLGSILCLRLFTAEDLVGGLNLYSFRPGAFDEDAVEEGLALAAHVALAVVSARRIAQLHQALDSRTSIAAAVGILMERFDLTYDRAFAVLGRVSSQSNVKIRDLAAELIETGSLPRQP